MVRAMKPIEKVVDAYKNGLKCMKSGNLAAIASRGLVACFSPPMILTGCPVSMLAFLHTFALPVARPLR